jgi:hypothetical protein
MKISTWKKKKNCMQSELTNTIMNVSLPQVSCHHKLILSILLYLIVAKAEKDDDKPLSSKRASSKDNDDEGLAPPNTIKTKSHTSSPTLGKETYDL